MSVRNGATVSSVTGFGAVLRRWRRAEGWTQEELAERSGMDQGTVSAIEVGRSKPTMDTVRRIAAAFKRPVADVATEAGYLDADEPAEGALPPVLVEVMAQMVRDYPELKDQFAERAEDDDFPAQIRTLAKALHYVVRGFLAEGDGA